MIFVITYDSRYGYAWELRDYRQYVVARSFSSDYQNNKTEVLNEIKRIKDLVFHAMVRDNTPAKHG